MLLAAPFGIDAVAAEEGDVPKNRRSGGGALLGYGVGLGAAVAFTALRPAVRHWLPWPNAGTVLGAATLVTSEGAATALGATDWAAWSALDWTLDIIPRTLYGLTVAYVVEALDDDTAAASASDTNGRLPNVLPEGSVTKGANETRQASPARISYVVCTPIVE